VPQPATLPHAPYNVLYHYKPEKVLKQLKHEKLTFSNTSFEKSNSDVCLADAFLGCGDSVNSQFG
jgi:uncharacterized lipoprotein YehR (DUF1307 family)